MLYEALGNKGYRLSLTAKDNEIKQFLVKYENPKENRTIYVFGNYIFSDEIEDEHKLLFERTEYAIEEVECSGGQPSCPS